MERKLVIDRFDPVTVEIYRRMPAGQKLQIASGLWKTARQMVRAGIKLQHPHWTDEQVDRLTASRMSHGAL